MGIKSVSGFLRIISFLFSLNGIIFQLAECGPNGASPTACGDMTPQHGFPAMTSSPPYSLTIQTNYVLFLHAIKFYLFNLKL